MTENLRYFLIGFCSCLACMLLIWLMIGAGWALTIAVVAVAALAAECLKPGVLKRGMQCIVADRARWA